MVRKIMLLVLSILFMFNMCGCVMLLAGAAGGATTATWLSGKLTQEVNYSLDKSLNAVSSAMRYLKFDIEKQTKKDDVAQVIGEHSDGKTIWIDIHRISSSSSRIGVRVGAFGDKEAARKILDKILRYL